MMDLRLQFLDEMQKQSEQSVYDGNLRQLTAVEVKRRSELHPDLRLVYDESRKELLRRQSVVLKPMDIFLVYGNRGKEAQNLAFKMGFSKVQFPDSKHNQGKDKTVTDPDYCSDAMDVCPFPVPKDWDKEIDKFRIIVNVMMEVASRLFLEGKIKNKIRFGADFNMDGNLKNDKFVDLPHCECVLRS